MITLDKFLEFENEFMLDEDYEPWYQKAAKQAQNENGKLAVYLKNGAKVVFADFCLPHDSLCIPSTHFALLPSKVLLFLAGELPTEDTEINFVGGTIVKKKVKEIK